MQADRPSQADLSLLEALDRLPEGATEAGLDLSLLELPALQGRLFRSLMQDLVGATDSDIALVARRASRIGQRVGNIRLVAMLGRGGMGEVYEGWDELLERSVAVKVLADRAEGWDTKARARLLQEARALARLDHPGICRLYDLVESDGEQFLILELIDGVTLRARNASEGFANHEVLDVVRQVAEALAVAHRAGIVHRDLKPDNVMLLPDGNGVKVMDFGIARWIDLEVPGSAATGEETPPPERGGERAATLTRTGSVLGTVRYMSPEQARGEEVTTASDIYSLGALIIELLTQSSPYGNTETPLELWVRVGRGEIEVPVAPEETQLTRLVREMTTLEPGDRPTAKHVTEGVGEILEGPRRRRRRRARWLSAGIGLALLASIAYLGIRDWTQSRVEHLVAGWELDLEWMEEQLQHAYTAPRHDVREERSVVEARLAALRAEVERAGRWARPAGMSAVGRGYLLLADHEAAERHLAIAWEEDATSPETALHLGRALTGLVEERYREAERSGSPAQRDALRLSARRDYGERALDLLSLGAEAVTDSPQFVQATISLLEDDYSGALQGAREAFEELPWLYRAKSFEARVLQLMAERAVEEGRVEQAAPLFEESAEAFGVALRVGRSDPVVHRDYCDFGLGRSHWDAGWGEDADPLIDRSLTSCRQAVEVDPESAGNHLNIGILFQEKAWRRQGTDLPMELWIRAGKEAIETSERLRPTARAFASLGVLLTLEANDRIARHLSARDSLLEAREAFDRAKELAPSSSLAFANSTWATFLLAETLRDSGGDPRPGITAAEEDFQRVVELVESLPKASQEHIMTASGNLGWGWGVVGQYLTWTGGEATPAFERAIELLEIAFTVDPESMGVTVQMAEVQRMLALFLLTSGQDFDETLERARIYGEKGIEKASFLMWPYYTLAGTELMEATAAIGESGGRNTALAREHLERARAHAAKAHEIGDPLALDLLLLARIDLYEAILETGGRRRDRVRLGLSTLEQAEPSNQQGLVPLLRGLLHLVEQEPERAAESFGEAVQLNPNLEHWVSLESARIAKAVKEVQILQKEH